jgi:hypothetical protein
MPGPHGDLEQSGGTTDGWRVPQPDRPSGADPNRLHPYVEFAFTADPIAASEAGDARRADRLGEVTPDAIDEQCATRRRFLREAELLPMPASGTREWLEHQVLLTELRSAVAADEHVQVWRRAPYWYPERIGAALSSVMSPIGDCGADPVEAQALVGRLREIPGYLSAAAANLTDQAPTLWAEMGCSAAQGLSRHLQVAVPAHAARLPVPLAADVAAAAALAGPAVTEFAEFCRGLATRAAGSWECGAEYFDGLLRDQQHLDLDAVALAEAGRRRVESDRQALVEFAEALDPRRDWREQIDAVKDDHPEPADFLSTYDAAMRSAARHTAEADLIGLPPGETCEMDWVPDYRREGLPLGVMSPSAPFAPGLRSEFLITPADPAATEDRRRQHARDNCYVFATSIAGHETYPGHHVQAVHHKIGTERGSMLRYVRCPQFVEGWGLYVEDLLEETGYMIDDRVRLFKRRNALWRALRIVIDVGLHTRTLSVEQAVSLLTEQAGMDRHMAAGEVRRYTRHDNPTYPSSYALGRDAFHAARAAAGVRPGVGAGVRPGAGAGVRSGSGVRAFHDEVLSHGSPPVALVSAVLQRRRNQGSVTAL